MSLPPIKPTARRDEATLWRNFGAAAPYMLGACLSIIAESVRCKASVALTELPRMADFALWSTAAEVALGWDAGGFMEAFRGNQDAALEVGAESSALTQVVRSLLQATPQWDGTPSELLAKLETYASERQLAARTWPCNAGVLGNQLRRLVAPLQVLGIGVEFSKAANNMRTRQVHLRLLTSDPW